MSAIAVKTIRYVKVGNNLVDDSTGPSTSTNPNPSQLADVGTFEAIQIDGKVKTFSRVLTRAVRAAFGNSTVAANLRNVRDGAPFQIRGYVAIVDLTRCDVLVSSNSNNPYEASTEPSRSVFPQNPDKSTELFSQRMCTTAEWAIFNQLDLAINANFFVIPSGMPVSKQMWTKTIGLSRGKEITAATRTEPRIANRTTRTSSYDDVNLLFRPNGTAFLQNANKPVPPKEFAPNGVAGSWLIGVGMPMVNNEPADYALIPAPHQREARTAVGLMEQGRKLLIVMFEKQIRFEVGSTYNVLQILNTNQRGHTDQDFVKLAQFIEALGDANEKKLPQDFRKFLSKKLGVSRLQRNRILPDKMVKESILDYAGVTARVQRTDVIKIKNNDYYAATVKITIPRSGGVNEYFLLKLTPHREVEIWPNKNPGVADVLTPPPVFKDDRAAGEKISGYIIQLINADPTQQTVNPDMGSNPKSQTGADISVGITLPELRRFLMTFGITEAVNLDGSGSSAFVYNAQTIFNAERSEQAGNAAVNDPRSERVKGYIVSAFADRGPSDVSSTSVGKEDILKPRPAGNHLGFKIR